MHKNPLAFAQWFEEKFPGRTAILNKEIQKGETWDVNRMLKLYATLDGQ